MGPDETSCLGSVCQVERTPTNRTRHLIAQTHFFPLADSWQKLAFELNEWHIMIQFLHIISFLQRVAA